jgi:hypothetical protein
MRLAALASMLTAGLMWLALGGNPAQSQSQSEKEPTACQTCGQGGASSCPHCAAKKGCPHCKGHGFHGAHAFEYKCVHQSERANKKAADAMSAQFSGLGEDGWRLAKADNGFWCFSRFKAAK